MTKKIKLPEEDISQFLGELEDEYQKQKPALQTQEDGETDHVNKALDCESSDEDRTHEYFQNQESMSEQYDSKDKVITLLVIQQEGLPYRIFFNENLGCSVLLKLNMTVFFHLYKNFAAKYI